METAMRWLLGLTMLAFVVVVLRNASGVNQILGGIGQVYSPFLTAGGGGGVTVPSVPTVGAP